MRKIRKNTQLTLTNPKGAGRPAKTDKGIVVDHRNSADIKKIIGKSIFLSNLRQELKSILDQGVVTIKLLRRDQYLRQY